MITMKSLKHGAIALLLVAAFITTGVYEAAAELVLFGTTGRSGCLSTLIEIDQNTGETIREVGPVGYGVNGMTWDQTTGKLYASARGGNRKLVTSGTHQQGGSASAFLYDPSKNFHALGVTAGMRIVNETDGSYGPITSVNSATNLSAALAWGTDNLWETGDSYSIYEPGPYIGLIEIDPGTGAGTPVGVDGWALVYSQNITTLAVNPSTGQMFAWLGNNTLLTINKDTGVATVVGTSNATGRQHGLAFDNTNTLYLVDGGGAYYIINTSNAAGTYQGDIFPSSNEDAHHGTFHPYSDKVYFGLTTFWDGEPVELVRANLRTGTVISQVPTCCDCVHTLSFFEDTACILDLDLSYAHGDNELTIGYMVRTNAPARLILKFIVLNQAYNLAGVDLPPFDPKASGETSMPCPNIGNVGILGTLLTQEEGIACSAWETVDTGR